jgi:hypothetical protein
MWRGILEACLPWFGLLLAGVAAFLLLGRFLRARLELMKFVRLLQDERGTVQSLSFVLTLPFLVLIVLFIVQVAQLMVATIVVHYAAFAAARAAVVWIPARVDPAGEAENRISFNWVDPWRADQEFPALDPDDPNFGPSSGGLWYQIAPEGAKYEKIRAAAVLACAAVSPSRRVPLATNRPSAISPWVLQNIYQALVPDAAQNRRIPERLANKLDYANQATEVDLAFFHPNIEPPLVPWGEGPDKNQFYWNEIGWQDPVLVTVRFRVPLMPALGRILARPAQLLGGKPDSVAGRIENWQGIWVYPISASVMLGNEGDIPVYPYLETIW